MSTSTSTPEQRASARRAKGATYKGIPDRQTTMVRRILRTYRAAGPDAVAARDWYPTVASMLQSLADRTGHDHATAVAVFAETSPRVSVATNMAMTIDTLRTGTCSGLKARVRAAQRVVAGDLSNLDLDPAGTLSTSRKVRSFAANLQGDEHAVTVDVWAMRAAGVDVAAAGGQVTGGGYVAVADAYRRAAEILSEQGDEISPRDLQAVVWTAVRHNVNGAGSGAGTDDLQDVLEVDATSHGA